MLHPQSGRACRSSPTPTVVLLRAEHLEPWSTRRAWQLMGQIEPDTFASPASPHLWIARGGQAACPFEHALWNPLVRAISCSGLYGESGVQFSLRDGDGQDGMALSRLLEMPQAGGSHVAALRRFHCASTAVSPSPTRATSTSCHSGRRRVGPPVTVTKGGGRPLPYHPSFLRMTWLLSSFLEKPRHNGTTVTYQT